MNHFMRILLVAASFAAAVPSTTAHAQELEVVIGYPSTGLQLNVGVDRALFVIGLHTTSVSYLLDGSADSRALSLGLQLGGKFYLTEVDVGSVVPTLRTSLNVSYAHYEQDGPGGWSRGSWVLGLRGMVGITYFLDERVGLGASIGAGYYRSFTHGDAGTVDAGALAIVSELSLAVRFGSSGPAS